MAASSPPTRQLIIMPGIFTTVEKLTPRDKAYINAAYICRKLNGYAVDIRRCCGGNLSVKRSEITLYLIDCKMGYAKADAGVHFVNRPVLSE